MRLKNTQMGFNEETKSKLLELLNNGFITQDAFNSFFIKSNNKILKKTIQSQFKLTMDEIKTFTYELMMSWKSTNHILHHNEILVISILMNNTGTLNRKELETKSKLSKLQLAKALKLLEEEGAIDSICLTQNSRLIYMSQTFIKKYIK